MNDYIDKIIRLKHSVKKLEDELREKKFSAAERTLREVQVEHDKLRNWLYHAGR